MEKSQKNIEIAALKEKFEEYNFFYLCDPETLSVEKTNAFRRICFNQGVEYKVAKNTLIAKALEQITGNDYSSVIPLLHGQTGIMFAKDGAVPGKILKEFRTKNERPLLKGAYIDSDVFVGDNQLETLAKLKSKQELLGEIIGMLQSPIQNVISGLNSEAGNKIAGLVKALAERE